MSFRDLVLGKGCALFLLIFAPQCDGAEKVAIGNMGQGVPSCQVNICDKEYEAWVDLGRGISQADVTRLPPEAIQATEKTIQTRRPVTGEIAVKKIYEISELRMGASSFANLEVHEQTHPRRSIVKSETVQSDGSTAPCEFLEREFPPLLLGNDLFKDSVVLFDFAHSSVTIFSPDEDYSKYTKEWMQCPLIYEHDVYSVDVELDGAKRKLFLDNGTTMNFLYDEKADFEKPIVLSKTEIEHVTLAGKRLEVGCFHQTNRPGIMGEAGILGLPFFVSRPVLIDFPNNKMYFPVDSETT